MKERYAHSSSEMLLKQHFLSTIDDEWEDLFLVQERILHKSFLVLPQISLNKIQLINLQNKNVSSVIKSLVTMGDVSKIFFSSLTALRLMSR